jgi:uncharacterized protein
MAAITARNLNWLLSRFVDETEGAEQALAVSSDGLLIGASANFDEDDADRMAAVITGLQSLSEGACKLTRKGVLNRVVVDMEDGYLLIATVGEGATMGVTVDLDCDLGYVSYEMCMLIERVGEQVTPALIAELKQIVG